MALVVVERVFEEPESMAALQAKEDGAAWCLETHRVRFLRTFFAQDGRRMVCVYDAPDVESVRVTQRTAGLPVQHAWPAIVILDRQPEPPARFSTVIAQRSLEGRFTAEQIRFATTDPKGCYARHRLTHFVALLAEDLSRMICVYYSPDVESVRVASREGGIPLEHAWSGREIRPPSST